MEHPPMLVTADMFQAPMDWLKASEPKNMVLAFHQPIGAWNTSALPKIAESNFRQQTIARGVARAVLCA